MFNFAFFEGNRPVRVVIPDRCRNEETSRKLGVDHNLGAGIQFFHEGPFVLAVGEDVVIDVTLGLQRLAKVFLGLLLCEDVAAVGFIDWIVGQVLDDDRRFLLVDQSGGFQDEVFRVLLVLTEHGDVDTLENPCNRVTG